MILLVFVSITAYSLNFESKPEITVDEGHEEISIHYIENNKVVSFRNDTTGVWFKNTTAKTNFGNKESHLTFEVITKDMWTGSDDTVIRLKLYIEGNIGEEYQPEDLLFTMQELAGTNVSKNLQGFDEGFLEKENLKLWPLKECDYGTTGLKKSRIGFDIKENDFSAEMGATWTIPRDNWNNSYTLRLKSMVQGMSEDVTATVDLNIEGGFEG